MSKPINISASRGASILTYYDERLDARQSMSKWKTPVQTWLEIKESRDPGFCARNKYELPVFEENAAIRWGWAFESAIIKLAEHKQDNIIRSREKFYKYVLFNFITCHIDGSYRQANKKPFTLHEGKTTNYFTWRDTFGDIGTDRVPIEYQIQCQHQMICAYAEKVILSVLVWPKRVDEWEEMGWIIEKNNKGYFLNNKIFTEKTGLDKPVKWARVLNKMGYFHQYEIKADPELQKRMIADYTEWWERFILGDEVPEPTHYKDIKSLVTEPKGTVLATDEIISLMEERDQIKNEIKGTGPLAKRAEAIKVGVLDYMRKAGATAVDDDSTDKFILRDKTGKKLATYGKNKNGDLFFR